MKEEQEDLQMGEETQNRRKFLMLGGAAAVTAAAMAAGAVGLEKPALAANGNNVVIGTGNAGTVTTSLTSPINSATPTSAALVVTNYTLTSGVGISGYGSNVGVYGNANAGSLGANGVIGEAGTVGTGVLGKSDGGGIGLEGLSGSGPVLYLNAPSISTTVVPPTVGAWFFGSFLVDSKGNLWYCARSGTPGLRVKLSGSLQVVNPTVRAYDSRVSQGGPGPLMLGSADSVISLDIAGGLPVGASSALINLTVTGTMSNFGYLTVYENGKSVPATSNINWFGPNENLANNSTVAVDASGKIAVHIGGTTGAGTDFIVDILGYYL